MGLIESASADATSLVIFDGYPYDASKRRSQQHKVIFHLTETDGIVSFGRLLATEDGLSDAALMTWPVLTFVLLSGHAELAQVGYFPGWLRSEAWDGGDRRLLRPNDLEAWLAAHLGGS